MSSEGTLTRHARNKHLELQEINVEYLQVTQPANGFLSQQPEWTKADPKLDNVEGLLILQAKEMLSIWLIC